MSTQPATEQPNAPDQATAIHELLNTIEDMRDRALWKGDDPTGNADPLSEIAALGDRALVKFGDMSKGL